MEQSCCVVCGGDLKAWEIKCAQKTCESCLHRRRIAFLLSDTYVDKTFFTIWAKGFFKRLGVFLQEYEISLKSQTRMLPKAIIIFQEAEKTFRRPEEMSGEWLETQIKLTMPSKQTAPTFFRIYLIREQLISPQEEEKRIESMQAKIELLPQGYRRLVEVYFNERKDRRKRHIKHNARKPLSLRALEHDLETLTRAIRWFREYLPELTGWHMIQENHILTYLLTLSARERELVRNDLYVFFCLAHRRKLVTHVPVAKYPSRKFPPAYEPLNLEARKALARLIRESIYSHPYEAFLTVLCFYHGLSSSQVLHIRMSDVDIEKKVIHIPERPPVYLLTEDFLLLEQFLQQRQEMPYAKQKSYLVISNQHRLNDKPLDKSFLRCKVLSFVKYPPQLLRMTCFTALSEQFGPQYLVEACGISLTHAARYGKMEEYLLEEEVMQQRDEFLKLSRQLEQSEKQRAERSHSKKEE